MKIPTLLFPFVLPFAAAVSAAREAPPIMDLPDLNKATALSLEELLCLQTNRPPDERAEEGLADSAAPRRTAPNACSSTGVPDAEGRFNPVPQGWTVDFIVRVRAQ